MEPIERYIVYERKPNDNFFREDIFIGNSCYIEIINDYYNYNIDAVVNISKIGEMAVYLAYVFADNEDNNFEDENINKKLLDERNQITDELESIMGKKGSGKEIGIILCNTFVIVGGYMDLLLYNQDEFVKRAKEVLRNYNYKFRLLRFRQYSEIIKTFNE